MNSRLRLSIGRELSSSSRATSSMHEFHSRTRHNYTRSLTRIIFIARVNVKMAATRKAVEEFSPISPQRRECGTFPLLFFLEMIHISLKEGWFICRGHECRCELFIYFLKILYTWECIENYDKEKHVYITTFLGECKPHTYYTCATRIFSLGSAWLCNCNYVLRTTYIAITIFYVSHVLKFPCTVLVHARGRPEDVYSPVHET